MSVITLNKEFLLPISSENSAGEEVDYLDSYLLLERELQGTPEQQYGEMIVAAEEPDWQLVLKLCSELLKKSKDFRVAIAYLRALSNVYSWDGCIQGFSLLIVFVEEFWETGYPVLEHDGEIDIFPRANALASLHAADGFLKDFKRLSVDLPNYGIISIADIERNRINKPDGNDYHIVQQDLIAAARDRLECFEKFCSLKNKLEEFIALLKSKLSSDFNPDVEIILKILSNVFEVAGFSGIKQGDEIHEDVFNLDIRNNINEGHLNDGYSRISVIARLNLICDEIERNEPSNPAPLLIKRAMQMIGLDFISILKELAPDSLNQFYNVIGRDVE